MVIFNEHSKRETVIRLSDKSHQTVLVGKFASFAYNYVAFVRQNRDRMMCLLTIVQDHIEKQKGKPIYAINAIGKNVEGSLIFKNE